MRRPSEEEVRETYADLLGEEADAATIRLIADLDAGLTASEPPYELWSRLPSRRTPSPAAQERGSLMDAADARMPAFLAGMTGFRRGRPLRLPSSPSPDPSSTRRAATGGRPYAIDEVRTGHGAGRGMVRLLHRRTLRPRWMHLPLLVGLLSLLAVGIGLAVSNITNLGKPVNIQSTNQYFPLDNFHRIGQPLQQQGRTELLFIGTLATADSKSAAQRWPVLKALEQFGTISNVRSVESTCRNHQIGPSGCSFPTFDWTHAHYRSSYLAFVHADILNAAGNALQRLSGQELQLYNRYARVRHSPFKNDPYGAFNTVLKSSYSSNTTRGLPLVVVGSYEQTQSQVVTAGDFETFPTPQPGGNPQTYIPPSVLPFATVRDSLLHASDPPQSHLVEDINADTNIITALICHADGKKPASVCDRPAIKQILKSVKK